MRFPFVSLAVWAQVGLSVNLFRRAENTSIEFTEYLPGVNYITDLCNSNSFRLTSENLQDSKAIQYYGHWTQKYLPKYLKEQDGVYEKEIAGNRIFGVPNLGCNPVTGTCTSIPDCEHIAISALRLKQSVKPEPDEERELRQRYLLAQRFENGLQYYAVIKDAIKEAKTDVMASSDEIARMFGTMQDKEAADNCHLQKTFLQVGTLVLAGAIAIALAWAPEIVAAPAVVGVGVEAAAESGGLAAAVGAVAGAGAEVTMETTAALGVAAGEGATIGAAGGAEAGAAKAVVIFTQGQVSGTFSNTVFALTAILNNIGLWESSVGPQPYTSTDGFDTVLDLSRCSNNMGSFANQFHQIDLDIKNTVERAFDRFTEALDWRFHYGYFHNGTLPDGRSHLAAELAISDWLLPFVDEDTNKIRDNLKEDIVDGAIESLISQVLRARQCFIKCAQIEGPDDPRGLKVDTTNATSPLNLATFYPEMVLGLEDESKVTLQCQFACLKQNDDAVPYLPEDTLIHLKNNNWSHPYRTPHEFFTQAVLNNLGQSPGRTLLQGDLFKIPVCISKYVLIDDPSADYNDNYKKPWYNMKSWVHWANTTRSFFPLQCGDWKASDTRRFIGQMPLQANRKSQEDFYYHTLEHSMDLLHHRPFTHFATLCALDYRFAHESKMPLPWSSKNESEPREIWTFQNSSEPMCNEILKDVYENEMTELEANFMFCWGPKANSTLNLEKQVDHHRNFLLDWWNADPHNFHRTLCAKMGNYSSPFGFDNSTYKDMQDDFKDQLQAWVKVTHEKLQPGFEIPFKWNPKNPLALSQPSDWPAYPPILPELPAALPRPKYAAYAAVATQGVTIASISADATLAPSSTSPILAMQTKSAFRGNNVTAGRSSRRSSRDSRIAFRG